MVTWFVWPRSSFAFLLIYHTFIYIHININTCLIFTRDIRQPLSQIRLSLSVSLGAGQIIFLAGIKATEKTVGGSLPYLVLFEDILLEWNVKKGISPFLLKAICVTVAAVMQYFLMAAFCWMLVEGIYLYLFVVKVYNINTKMHMYHVISWGISMTYFITTCIGGSTVLSNLVLSSSQVLWIYFFVFMGRFPYDHDGHFTWHCCCERRNTKLCQW